MIVKNPANSSQVTLSGIEHNRYIHVLLLSDDFLIELMMITSESMELFKSRKFSLHKWAANLFTREVDLSLDPLPNYSALGWILDTQSDVLRIRCRIFVDPLTPRKILSQLASQFDPLGVGSPFSLGQRLILQNNLISGYLVRREATSDYF